MRQQNITGFLDYGVPNFQPWDSLLGNQVLAIKRDRIELAVR
jgi:hypothetical protein